MARRSGLGKGLGALIPTEARDRDSALRVVPMTSIKPNPLQPRTRFDEEAMSSLASSIREVGVLQPILVREIGEDEYELIAGERRWRAARRAGLQTMPVLVQSVSDVHSLEQALVENLHREDLNPLEEAGAFQQLVDEFGYTHEQVAVAGRQEPDRGDQHPPAPPAPGRRAAGPGRRRHLGRPRPGPAGDPGPELPGGAGQAGRGRGSDRPGRRGRGPPPRVGRRGRGVPDRERESRHPGVPRRRCRCRPGPALRRCGVGSPPPACSSSRTCSPTTSTPGSRSRWGPSEGGS